MINNKDYCVMCGIDTLHYPLLSEELKDYGECNICESRSIKDGKRNKNDK